MVESIFSLDPIFGSLADPTRRDILSRLLEGEMNVSEVAEPYDMSLAAVSKHLKILREAKLIRKRREGKQQMVSLAPEAMMQAMQYFTQYERIWHERFDRLEMILNEEE